MIQTKLFISRFTTVFSYCDFSSYLIILSLIYSRIKMKKLLYLFIFYIFISFSCDSASDKEYMKSASGKVEKGDISEAISDYQKVVNEFPDSELAPEAIVRQASLYHDNKVKNVKHIEALNKAADLFFSVSDKYPESEQAGASLFMAGFIYANELQDYTKAKAVYNLFLKKYPRHELADDATEELENIGLTPEEILQKKITAQGNK
jgi:outer membrane protein assembly factor BamD (BamD/ComL family)